LLCLAGMLWPRLGPAEEPPASALHLVLRAPAAADRLDLRGADLRTDVTGSRMRLAPRSGPAISFSLTDRVLRLGLATDSGLTPPRQATSEGCVIEIAAEPVL